LKFVGFLLSVVNALFLEEAKVETARNLKARILHLLTVAYFVLCAKVPMSLPPRILCRTGCGDFGDPELDHLCVDCHGDRVEAEKQRDLQEYVRQKEHSKQMGSLPTDAAPKTRRGLPSINHQKGRRAICGQDSLFF
jgi:hypothetical protein